MCDEQISQKCIKKGPKSKCCNLEGTPSEVGRAARITLRQKITPKVWKTATDVCFCIDAFRQA